MALSLYRVYKIIRRAPKKTLSTLADITGVERILIAIRESLR